MESLMFTSKFLKVKNAASFVVGDNWNPEADLLYHWTRNIEGILQSEIWEAGSLTTNPGYEFASGEQYPYKICLVFDRRGMKLEEAPKTVPWEEWEVLSKNNVPVESKWFSSTSSPFLGFGVRTEKDKRFLLKEIEHKYGEKDLDLFEIHKVPIVTPKKLQNKPLKPTV